MDHEKVLIGAPFLFNTLQRSDLKPFSCKSFEGLSSNQHFNLYVACMYFLSVSPSQSIDLIFILLELHNFVDFIYIC